MPKSVGKIVSQPEPNGTVPAPYKQTSTTQTVCDFDTNINTTIPDGDLIRWYQSGSDHALEMLFDRYEDVLFRFLFGILKNHHWAEDALQETWCQALQHLDKIDTNHLRGWLFTVAYHQAMLVKRRQKGQTHNGVGQSELIDPSPCPHTQIQEREELKRVQALLEYLPAAQREVICQRIYEGKRFRDIATDLDCPLNTALARMHEGIKRLRRLWGPDYV